MTRDLGSERASMPVEVAILAPLVVLAIIFVAWTGAQQSADGATMAAARSAARAAALAKTPGDADTLAGGVRPAVSPSLCASISVQVDTSGWEEGFVTATATCRLGSASGSLGSGGVIVRSWVEPTSQKGLVGR